MIWLSFLKNCAEIDKMLNVSIKSLASRFLKKSCASCASMSINLFALDANTRRRESIRVSISLSLVDHSSTRFRGHLKPGGVPIEWVKNTVFLRVSSWSFV